MHNTLFTKIKNDLLNNNKQSAVKTVLDALEQSLDVTVLYEDILTPILNSIDCEPGDYRCVWLEHQMSAITRSLVELSYPYVIKDKETLIEDKNVLVVCPKEEYHELGAVMGTQMLERAGFSTTFIGANTPLDTIESALKSVAFDYVVLSVSNSYNLVAVKRIITHLRTHFPTLKILGAGRGFIHNYDVFEPLLDAVITSFESIQVYKQKAAL